MITRAKYAQMEMRSSARRRDAIANRCPARRAAVLRSQNAFCFSNSLRIAALCFIGFSVFTVLLCSCENSRAQKVPPPVAADIPLKEICARDGIPLPLKSPSVVVYKKERRLELYSEGKLLKTYPVALGPQPRGAKERSGDGRTPEGNYYMLKHISPGFGESFYISYPNIADAGRGLREKLISETQLKKIVRSINRGEKPPHDTKLGGLILLHGTKNREIEDLTSTDWTAGCISVENPAILEIYSAVKSGTRVPVKILPAQPPSGIQ